LIYRVRTRLAKRKAIVATALAGVALAALVGFFLLGRLWGAERRAHASRSQALDQLRKRTGTALEAALELRRAGKVQAMAKFGRETEEACREAMRDLPDSPEPHYRLGKMYRALMRNEEALVEQDRALLLDPNCAPALYERAILTAHALRRRGDELVAAAWREGGGLKIPMRDDLLREDPLSIRLRQRLEGDVAKLSAASLLEPGHLQCVQGVKAWCVSEYPRARESLREAVAEGNALVEAFETLSDLEGREGHYDRALEWLNEGLKQDAGYLPFVESRARLRTNWGNREMERGADPRELFQEAVADATSGLSQDPRSLALWTLRGAVRMLWGTYRFTHGEDPGELYREALEDCDRASELAPEREEVLDLRADVRLRRALQLQRLGEDPYRLYLDAIADRGEAIQRNPSREMPWLARGVARLNLAIYLASRNEDPRRPMEEAIEDFGEALKRAPQRGEYWIRRGLAWDLLGSAGQGYGQDPREAYRAAMRDFTIAIERGDAMDEGWMRRGATRLHWASYEFAAERDPSALCQEALRDFDRALKSNQDRDESYCGRARTLTLLGQWKTEHGEDGSELYRGAISDATKAIERNAFRAESWLARGSASYELSLLESAIPDLDRSVQLNRLNATAWKMRGLGYESLADQKVARGEEAISEYRAALESYSEMARIDSALATALAESIEKCRGIVNHP